MSEGVRRKGCGCSPFAMLALLFLVTAVAVTLGYVLGRHGLQTEFGPGIGVLDIYGEIVDERPILDDLDEIANDPDTKAIVVRVDSPGGAIAVVEEVYNALERLKKDGVPIVASMGSTAASGGYFVCLPADRIFANRSSLTGSIGALVEFSSARELLDKLGVKFETVASGEYKAMGSISQPLTDREREHMQGIINDYKDFFVGLVSEARHLKPEDVRALADGRVFTGRQAIELGLVDELGDQETAIDYAASLAGIKDEPRIIQPSGPGPSLWDFVDRFTTTAAAKVERHLAAPKFLMR